MGILWAHMHGHYRVYSVKLFLMRVYRVKAVTITGSYRVYRVKALSFYARFCNPRAIRAG